MLLKPCLSAGTSSCPFYLVVALCLCAISGQANAQFGGHYGASVAVDGNHVFVMKPGGPFGGIAAVYVYDQSSGTWAESQRLYARGASDKGEGLNPSMAAYEGQLVASASDPFLYYGAHLFQYDGSQWQLEQRVPINTDVSDEALSTMSLNDFMKFVQPPARSVAFDGSRLAISVQDGASPFSGVHIFGKEGNEWVLEETIEAGGARAGMQFGMSMAWGEDFLIVGAPRGGAGGRAYVFEPGADGSWVERAILESDSLVNNAGLGSSMAIRGNQVILGAPGTPQTPGAAIGFERNPVEGKWMEQVHLGVNQATAGARFGQSVAFVGGEIWIGTPNAQEATGAVYRYTWQEGSTKITSLPPLLVTGTQPSWLFGSALAGNESVAIVGAPGANGGDGQAALFTRNEQGRMTLTSWLMPEASLQPITGSENRCEEGSAMGFECNEVDLLSFLPINAIGGASGERVSDIWGWTDPLNNREYALIGRTGGAAIIDVTNPTQPVYVGLVTANPTNVRDLKVYQNHLFFTGDGAGDHGLVVFDLTRLRTVEDLPATFEPDAVYSGIASAHNLILDEESGFAYPVGASGGGETCGGGLHMIDIRDPLNPTFAGCYTDTIGLFSDGRTHDGQCVAYKGPDTRYAGRQVCFVSNETGLRIVDVTDKETPAPLAVARYPRAAYVHQGWLTEDQRYFYLNDELDELVGMTPRTRTIVWDVAELDDPVLVGEFSGETTATDHNLYIKGDRMYQANYESGLRVWDVSNPESPREIGYFDTTPGPANPPGFYGAWTAYPYFESGTVIVSSIGEGLFIVKPRQQEQVP